MPHTSPASGPPECSAPAGGAARLLARRDATARAAASALAHRHEDAGLLEHCQYELEEQLEQQLPTQLWRQLYPRWRQLDIALAHDPDTGQRQPACHRCTPTGPPTLETSDEPSLARTA